MGKKYRVKDNQSGRTVTFTWNADTPPGEADLEEVFKSSGVREQQAQQMMTAHTPTPTQGPPPPQRGTGNNVFQQILAGLAPAMAPTLPLERAEGIGTIAEIGLPMLSALISGGASIPAAGALSGAGTLGKQYLMEAAGGAPTTTGEKFTEAGKSAAFGAVGQGIGLGAGKLIQKAAAPMAKYVEPQSLMAAKKMGIDYFPSEVLAEKGALPATQNGRVFGCEVKHCISLFLL